MLKKLIAGQVLQVLVIPMIIAYILAQCPWILSLNVTNVTYAGGKRILVTGTAEFARDNEHWYGPDSMEYFQAWWNSDEAKDIVFSESLGIVTLITIKWTYLIQNDPENGESYDELGFVALLEINPGALRSWRPLKSLGL